MIKRLKPKSEFSRNVLTLMTGTTIAQAIPIVITPILTRLYSPEDFGLLALFVAITMILGSIANGRYELAIMLPEDDEDAINIAALGLLIASIFSLLLLLLAIFLNTQLTDLLGNQDISFWLYFVPLVVWLVGLYNVLNYLNNRKKLYKDIANASIYKSTAMAAVQLAYGFIKASASGLIWGQIASNMFANIRLSKNIIQNYELKSVTRTDIKRLGKRYSSFPKYSMWAILANNLSTQLTNILISIIYSVGTLGYYSLAQKMLGMPSALIGNSISQVFFKIGSVERYKTGKVIIAFDSTIKKLMLLALPIFVVMFFIVEDVFAIVFSENWRIAGTYSMILTPMFAARFIVSAVSSVDTIMEKQNIFLLFNVLLLLVSLAVVLVAKNLIFEDLLKLLSLTTTIVYITYGFILRKMARNEFYDARL